MSQPLRFAIAAVDRYIGVFEAFVQAGWRPVKLFTVPMTPQTDSHMEVVAYAEQHKAQIQLSRITDHDLHELGEAGCDILIVASYNWRIGNWHPALKYGINFHPSPLPEGRGPYPAVRAILEGRKSWGITCHKLAPEIDSGDMLAAENFPMSENENHESLDLKLQMAARRLAGKVANNFTTLWQNAQPQTGGSYWPRWTNEARLIDFTMPVEHILRHLRAFGLIESLARLDHLIVSVKHTVGWRESHSYLPGQIVHTNNRAIVVAAADGYIGILDCNIVPADVLKT